MARRRKLQRLITAFAVLVSLLFAQLAMASYVCPGASDADAMAEMIAAGEPCEGMDTAQPVLCHQYANGAPQNFEPAKVPTASQPAVVHVVVVPLQPVTEEHALERLSEAPLRPPPDPVFRATRRLRV